MGEYGRPPVVIGTYPTEFAAAMARNAIVEAGIPCEMLGIHTAGFRAEAPGFVKIIVPAEREAEARAILEGFKVEHLEDDWDDS
jgi:hypothetical protein